MKALLGTSWTVVGTLCFAAWQWSLMVIAARSAGGAEAVGALSVALAISTPAFLLFGMSLRQVAATDVQGRHHDLVYLRIRARALLVALATNVVIGLFVANLELFVLIAACSLLKATEAVSDIAYGLKQRSGSERGVGISQAGKAICQALMFGALIHLGVPLAFAIVSVAVLSFVLTLVFADLTPAVAIRALQWGGADESQFSSVSGLARSAAQSGIAACLIAIAAGLPRVVLESESGAAAVGAFAATMWMFMPGHVVANAVCQSLLSRAALSQVDERGGSLAAHVALFCGVSCLAVLFPGTLYLVSGVEPALLVFGSGFEVGGKFLLLASLANLAVAVASGCNYGAAAVHAHDVQLKAALYAAIVCLVASIVLIEIWSAAGALVAVGATGLVQAGVSSAFLWQRLSPQSARAA